MSRSSPTHPHVIWTVGHSTRSLVDFVALLAAHGIRSLVDVRQYPRSRRQPYFNDESLARELPARNIAYRHMPSLGGRRNAQSDSINLGWRNEQFRGYADYMQTSAFSAAISDLIDIASTTRTAIMCAEAVPWRCHRQLIADALIARHWKVLDILGPSDATPHVLTSFAQVNGNTVAYPTPTAAVERGLFDPQKDDQE